jgi:hypothetical protein
VAATFTAWEVYTNQRGQVRSEQSFGESLRDQLQRSIARLAHEQASVRRTGILVLVLAGGICPAIILLVTWRINQKPFSDDGYMLISLFVLCVWSVASGIWTLRRSVDTEILPRKRRLEALLRELDERT